jgi:ketosteroid isomerase-like protein
MKAITFMLSLTTFLALLVTPATAQGDDPSAVVTAYLDAAVAKNLDAALALVADNVTHTDTHAPPGLPSLTQGKADFGAYLKGYFDDPSYRLEYANVQANGETVTWTTKEWFDPNNAPPNFPLPIESHLQAVVANGKITSILLNNDPAWLEKLYASIPPEAIDPTSVVQLWTKAFNARDAEGLKATMSDDIVTKIVYGTPDDPVLTGKEAFLEVMQSSNEDHFTLEVSSLLSDGATVTGSYSGIGDDIRAHNVGPEIGTVEALVENGLIKTFTFVADAEFNQKYAEADAKLQAAQEQAVPSALPATGGEISSGYSGRMVGAGIALLTLGLVLLRRRTAVKQGK